VALHRYAVFASFEGATLDPAGVEKLTRTRAMHIEVAHAAEPLRVSAGVSAATLAMAVAAVAAEVAKVNARATLTSSNAIEVFASFLTKTVAVTRVP